MTLVWRGRDRAELWRYTVNSQLAKDDRNTMFHGTMWLQCPATICWTGSFYLCTQIQCKTISPSYSTPPILCRSLPCHSFNGHCSGLTTACRWRQNSALPALPGNVMLLLAVEMAELQGKISVLLNHAERSQKPGMVQWTDIHGLMLFAWRGTMRMLQYQFSCLLHKMGYSTSSVKSAISVCYMQ